MDRQALLGSKKYIYVSLLLAMLIFSSALVLHLYYQQGVYWDFITHYLYSKALISSYFYKSLANGTLPLAIQYENHFYLEPFRAPLMSIFIVPFYLAFAQNAIPYYLVFEVILLLLSAIYLAKGMNVNPLIVVPMIMVPYTMIYLTVLNGTEMLSLILAIFAIGLAVRGKWQSGILIALAAMAKYSSLVFVLPILFMPKGTRWNTLAAGFFTTMPWLAANYFIFGNPMFSYIEAIQQVFVAPPPSPTSIHAALMISMSEVFYSLVPFMLIAVLLAVSVYAKHRRLPKSIDYRYKITAAFCAVSLLAWFAFAVHGSIDTLPRWGYITYAGIVPLLALLIYDLIHKASKLYKSRIAKSTIVYGSYAYILLVFFALTFLAYTQMGSQPFAPLMGSNSEVLLSAVHQVHLLGLTNCSFISNAWPYLRFYGIDAHNPYYYNSTMYRYPIIAFYSFVGTGNSVAELNISKAYNYSGFEIMMPKNRAC
ncbi:MAG: hypothetical protein ACP5MZ_03780 [Candidatus Micrarchaeia archaeon]